MNTNTASNQPLKISLQNEITRIQELPAYPKQNRDISELECRILACDFMDMSNHIAYDENNGHLEFDELELTKDGQLNIYEYKKRSFEYQFLEVHKHDSLLKYSFQYGAIHTYFVNFIPDNESENGYRMKVYDIQSPEFKNRQLYNKPLKMECPGHTTSLSANQRVYKDFYRLHEMVCSNYIIKNGTVTKLQGIVPRLTPLN